MRVKRIIQTLCLVIGLWFVLALRVWANAEPVVIQFFWSEGCPHCGRERVFLEKLAASDEGVVVEDYEVSENRENQLLLLEMGQKLKADVSGVPFTVVGDEYITGFLDEETTGRRIKRLVELARGEENVEVEAKTLQKVTKLGQSLVVEDKLGKKSDLELSNIDLPGIGRIDMGQVRLPVFTLVMAVVDGFNPCAMWVLLFLISLLLGMKDRKRMWLLGLVFIGVSAGVYFLFIAAWLNLFLVVGWVVWIRVLVGLVALGAGAYHLKNWWGNKKGGCQVVEGERRKLVFSRIKEIVKKRHLGLALIGIAMLAVVVNIVELICSAGLPAVYTQVLTMSDLPRWQYYTYLLFYIFVFMMDDLLVFVVAMVTLKMTGIESKYSRASSLIGGVVMLMIGVLLLFKPELLMWG